MKGLGPGGLGILDQDHFPTLAQWAPGLPSSAQVLFPPCFLRSRCSLCNRITTVVLILMMACCDGLRRKVPLNFFALGLFVSAAGEKGGARPHLFTSHPTVLALVLTFHSHSLSLSLCSPFQTVVEGMLLGSVTVCVFASFFFFWLVTD